MDSHDYAERIRRLPPFVFSKVDELAKEKLAAGVDIIHFGLGDPDLPPPARVLKKLSEVVLDPTMHRYPPYGGLPELKNAIAQWYETRFDVQLDPKSEVLILAGAKEGMAHLPFAFINSGDGVLVPSLAYPVYAASTILAGGTPVTVPLREERGYLPDLEIVERKALDRSKILFLSYPSNPTAAVADEEFFEYASNFARKRDIIVANDNTYSEIYFDQKRPPSLLQIKGAKDHPSIEFHSLSNTFSLAGWRLGFAVGNKRVIEGLSKIKMNVDSGIFTALQHAGVVALEQGWRDCDQYRKTYQERRDLFCAGLKKMKLSYFEPQASFYVWVQVPLGFSSETFAEFLVREAGVVAVPGTAFGPAGQGHIRFALTLSAERIKLGLERMEKALEKR